MRECVVCVMKKGRQLLQLSKTRNHLLDRCARKIFFLCAQTSSGVQVLMEELIACYHQLDTIQAPEGTSPSLAAVSVHFARSRLSYLPRSPRRKDTRTALSC